ncbi:MAG: hypothetical protein SGI73_04835 [Chloroflexota bacterium]|nr:hypothetical protein [Chloroflexota bacterium]
MQRRRPIVPILLLVFAGLAALLYMQNQQILDTPPPTQIGTLYRVFPDLEVLNIAALQLINPSSGLTFTLQRDGDGVWTRPDGGALGETMGSDIARTMALLPYTRTLDLPADGDLSVYGLAPEPFLLVQMLLLDGSTHSVAIGDPARTNEGHYALVDDQDIMYFLLPEAVAFLITQFRDTLQPMTPIVGSP